MKFGGTSINMEEKTASVNLCTQTAFERKRLQYCTIFVRINQSVTVPMDWLQTDKKVNKPYVRLKTNNGSFIEKICEFGKSEVKYVRCIVGSHKL